MISQVASFPWPDKQGIPEEGRRIQRPKCCEKSNKDEDNSPKTLTDKKIYNKMYIKVVIGNDAISLTKEFSGKNGSKLAQRSPTNSHADVTKINKLKMVFRTNRRSLNYAPKEFKVNACARDPP